MFRRERRCARARELSHAGSPDGRAPLFVITIQHGIGPSIALLGECVLFSARADGEPLHIG